MPKVWKMDHPCFFEGMDFSSGVAGSRLFGGRIDPFKRADSGVELPGGMPCGHSAGKHHCNRLVPASNTGRRKSQFGTDDRKQK